MTDLDGSEFGAFFGEVWGYDSFAWQQRLAEHVLTTGAWPSLVDLPTGAGKTSVIDIALFALACQPERFPRRVVFVIDRRIVVDEVGRRVDALVDELGKAAHRSPDSAAGRVAARLAALASVHPGGDEPLIGSATLRGGAPVSGDWARWPDRPGVMVSTVDQFGSRLLFRGYGVSERMWPVYAGLFGNDCLIVLDEVHLAVPLAQTLHCIGQRFRHGPLPDRWAIVQMSATAPGGGERFTLQPELDLAGGPSDPFCQRMTARKPARLVTVGGRAEAAEAALPREIPPLVSALVESHPVVGVVVNRVATARAVARALSDSVGPGAGAAAADADERGSGTATTLLTGRMRLLDRDDRVGRVMELGDPQRDVSHGERHIVVATQSIEVGADLSFDAMITEVAPLDALRQRFGRLDRRGRAAAAGRHAPAQIVVADSTLKAAQPDPVYGDALRNCAEALVERFGEGEFDVGPLSSDLDGFGEGVLAERDNAPVLVRSYLDALVQTSPKPAVEPELAGLLHGLAHRDQDVDVAVVWRADLPPVDADHRAQVEAILQSCPPRAEEAAPIPLVAVRRWLRALPEAVVADIPGSSEEPGARAAAETPRHAFRWRGPDDLGVVAPGEIRPGDLLVVPASYGGLWQGTWDPLSTEEPADLGDRAQGVPGRRRRRRTLRLHPHVLPAEVPPPPRPLPPDDLRTDEEVVGEWLADVADDLGAHAPWAIWALPGPDGDGGGERWSVERYDAWWRGEGEPGPEPFYILTERVPTGAERDLDGSDANSFTGSYVTLGDHLRDVGSMAERLAVSCGLGGELARDVGLAGRLHDLGKVDERFQRRLHLTELAYLMQEEPLAKSQDMTAAQRRAAARASGYPDGMRHELASTAMVVANTWLLDQAHDPDLVLHLVATHHGYARPLPTPVAPCEPVDLSFQGEAPIELGSFAPNGPLALDNAERFWRLVDRYGWFGLAWLEAIFRLADHRQSEAETHG